jgi:hypothetical protein
MNREEFLKLSPEEQAEFESPRICYECKGHLVGDGHSTGDLHVICPRCNVCPDCEDGSV